MSSPHTKQALELMTYCVDVIASEAKQSINVMMEIASSAYGLLAMTEWQKEN